MPSKSFNVLACVSQVSPDTAATYCVPLNVKHSSWLSNNVVVVPVAEVVVVSVTEVVVVVVTVLVLEVVVVAMQSANVLSWYRSIASFR